MKRISLLIKPVSSRCNLDCKYCFYKKLKPCTKQNENHRLSSKTVENIMKNLKKNLNSNDEIEFAFQGGEPSLIGLEFYKDFVKKANENIQANVFYSFQTNGTNITEEYLRFFKENRFLIGLSIDGPKEIHDKYRIDHQGKGTFEKVMETKFKLDRYQIPYNILMVITENSAKYPEKIWGFIEENHLNYVQFINCMKFKDQEESLSFKPKDYNRFYSYIFKKWKDKLYSGEYISINIFDQWIRRILGDTDLSCSFLGRCTPQYVVETSGDIYPCDFFVTDESKCGNLEQNTLEEIFYTPIMQDFLKPRTSFPKICTNCPHLKICNSGCKKLRQSFLIEKEGYCGYKEFLNTNLKEAENIARSLI